MKNLDRQTYKFLHLSVFVMVLVAFLVAGDAHAQVASSPYRLIGIINGRDFIGAVLDDGKSGQILYQKGEQLPDGSRIAKVQNDRVTLKQGDGTSYELFLPQNAKPSSEPKSSTGSAAGSTAAPGPAPQNPARSSPSVNAAPSNQPSVPSIRNQDPGPDNASKKRGRNRRSGLRSPRSAED